MSCRGVMACSLPITAVPDNGVQEMRGFTYGDEETARFSEFYRESLAMVHLGTPPFHRTDAE